MATYYFLGDVLLGTSPRRPHWDDIRQDHCNSLLVCPTCGNTWGRIVFDGAQEWTPHKAGCRRHRYIEDVGGTFIHPWRKGCPYELPDGVVKYEFELRLANLEREMENGQQP